jgi:CDP-4-dehydro-6-deoxyglucose reductase
MPKVQFTSGTQINVQIGKSILEEASSSGVALPYSCRIGRCNTCKCRIIEGETYNLHTETGLSDAEKKEGWILSCARSASTDLIIEAEELSGFTLPKPKLFPCRISQINSLTSDVLQIKLRLPPSSKFSFLPGQYIELINTKGVNRSYSLANSSSEKELELYIKKINGGAFSEYWFQEAKVDDLLRLKGPHGTFFLRDNNDANLIFLATGTGIAPIKSILSSIEQKVNHQPYRSIDLFWGARTQADLYIDNQWTVPSFSYTPILSRAPDSWSGAHGHVQNHLLDRLRSLKKPVIYACGSNEMISKTKSLLQESGFTEIKFYSDAFVCSAPS